jgi:hypothetical protein
MYSSVSFVPLLKGSLLLDLLFFMFLSQPDIGLRRSLFVSPTVHFFSEDLAGEP